MSDLWVLGAIARASPAVVRAWRASVARAADVRALPRRVAPPGAPDLVVDEILKKWADPRASESVEMTSRNGVVTVVARVDGPDAGMLVHVVAALAALGRAGAAGQGALACADGSIAFAATIGPRWSLTRVGASDVPDALESAPLVAAARYVARSAAALGGARDASEERDESRHADARAQAARLFGDGSNSGFEALARAKGEARRRAAVAALGWIAHDVDAAERRKRIQRDPRWIELALPLLEDGTAREDAIAVATLAKDRRAVAPLRKLVARGEGNLVRLSEALARIGDPSAIPELEAARARQKLPWMRDAAAKAIAKLRAVK